ncbi:MAG: MMPL family transporter [Actinomycetaceae bacterium]|nr:MMPL family transporter [Actinomycetaceae bacterium]
MASVLSRVGRWSATHAKTVIAIWLLVVALLGAGLATAGTNLTGTNRINESESIEGLKVLSERLPQAAGASEQVLFTSESASIDDHQAAIRSFIEQAQAIDGISQVSDPFAQQTNAISPDGTSALVTVQTDTSVGIAAGDEPGPKATKVSRLLDDLIRGTEGEDAALTVQRSGTIGAQAPLQLSATEFFGVVVALIVLLVTLGSLVAAGAPLVSAFIGVGTGMLGILLASSFFEITTITPVLAIMIGLAVGIDYALFILSRTREHLAAGSEPRQAAALANATAGSAVVFAGSTVLVGLCALAIARIPFLTTMGLAAAAMVFVAMLVSITSHPR